MTCSPKKRRAAKTVQAFTGFCLRYGFFAALEAADYSEDAVAYLKDGGMTEEEIAALLALITE